MSTARNLSQIKQGKSMIQSMSSGSGCKREIKRSKGLPPRQLGLGRRDKVRTPSCTLRTTVGNLVQIKQGKFMFQPMSSGSGCKKEMKRFKVLPPNS